ARTLSPEEALARVNADASAPLRAKAASAAESLKLASTTSTTSGSPAVYLFENASSGFMLVAADDVAQPLLGYSDAPAQGEIPPQMQQWLQAYAAEIEAVQAAENSGITTLQIPEASPASRPQRRAIAPLLTTRWDQIAPYNNDCPMQGSERTYTGCVATAIAQIMKYFNYPAHGTGTGTATVGTTEYTMDLGVDFQWDLMLDSYTGSSYTKDQAAAVATLMKACGFATEMEYSSSASGTPSSKVVPALTGNFGYDPGARLYYRDYYGLTEWENMVYDNLANVGPVYYDGSATGGGHAFVCDGYSADGFFHFNWGWSGMYNGYFLLTALNPSGQGIGGYAGGYNTSQSAVLGIRRPTGTAAPAPDPQLFLDLGDQPLAASLSGNTLTLSTEYQYGGWWNLTGSPFSGQIGCRFTNVASPSDVRYAVLGNTGTIAERTGYQSIPVSLTSVTLTPGATYSVEVVTRSGSSGQWFAARVPVGRIGYALVTRSAAGSYSVSVPADESFTWEDGSIDSEIYYKQPAKITVTLANNTDTELMRMVAPILFTLSGNTPTLKALADGELFDLESGQSETREMVFTFDKFYNNMQVNTRVYVGLLDLQTSQILGQ
ncbi:MAG: C10 family peptidase, partial [Muribaculaceae bacterium]|nr:C10 family peptidase [Muribaculaceae bacterium]